MSDIRVSVQWKSSAVFAGESIDCIVTFKNVAQARRRSPSPSPLARGPGFQRERWKDSLPSLPARRSSVIPPRRESNTGGTPLESRVASSAALSQQQDEHGSMTAGGNGVQTEEGKSSGKAAHRRSLSIVSMGTNMTEELAAQSQPVVNTRPNNGHSRAASMQILPRRGALPSPSPTSAPGNDRSFTVPSPLVQHSPGSSISGPHAYAMARSRSQTNSLASFSMSANAKKQLTRTSSSRSRNIQRVEGKDALKSHDHSRRAPNRILSPHLSENGEAIDPSNSISKILSPASLNGTPRSSGEFYSLSNNSTETLASEYIATDVNRSLLYPGHSRQSSAIRPPKKSAPEVLMMGFGQITGSCVLDGSLINQGPFEEVKKKAIIGGRGGGGVVRSASTKRDSGLLGSFGWSSIGDSFGGLLGGNEISSIKEAKKTASSRSIPLLSTPQSILFVDLRLEPGDSKSFTFSHLIPRGLPPTHKGKAMRIVYNLVIGTQRASQAAQNNHIQRVEVPFKILPGVNANGEILGHDLMSPHTILSDMATTIAVDDALQSKQQDGGPIWPIPAEKAQTSSEEFSSYVEKLLVEGAQKANQGLLSPTEADVKTLPLDSQNDAAVKDLIDMAIIRSNLLTSAKQSANRFEIKRGGDKVAVIMLARPSVRLGETISVVIDFQDTDVSCYALRSSLESWETIDPTIALRSKASIHRATRKIHASNHEATISASKVFFSPSVPITAVPEFITSGVRLEWGLRFEFVTSRNTGSGEGAVREGSDEEENGEDELLEEVFSDERGSVKAAVQGLLCETFDVTVPIRVYGAVGSFDENTEAAEYRV